ncbi:Protein AF-10 [Orchesella cincta]|uniref:Protein AF-10 n=1 Tax=Orchesella cincta TaxID=48709 RepID=A0A1D2MSI9_ORCCI|nr:Protein AF-10 [Orchesella cincta]
MSKEMLGGCCVCSDERGWDENPLVYCDGQGCNVAVHQACYGIVTVPSGPWYCRKCELQERPRCELCPSKEGAFKKTDQNSWAHVVCALYIPEVRFGNVTTMEPILISLIPQERFNKTCYICEDSTRTSSKASFGACMQCNKTGCKTTFHVTCAQMLGLLCEEAGNMMDNVKYCGYCQHHYAKLVSGCKKTTRHMKIIPPFRPVPSNATSRSVSPAAASPEKMAHGQTSKSSGGGSSSSSGEDGKSGSNAGPTHPGNAGSTPQSSSVDGGGKANNNISPDINSSCSSKNNKNGKKGSNYHGASGSKSSNNSMFDNKSGNTTSVTHEKGDGKGKGHSHGKGVDSDHHQSLRCEDNLTVKLERLDEKTAAKTGFSQNKKDFSTIQLKEVVTAALDRPISNTPGSKFDHTSSSSLTSGLDGPSSTITATTTVSSTHGSRHSHGHPAKIAPPDIKPDVTLTPIPMNPVLLDIARLKMKIENLETEKGGMSRDDDREREQRRTPTKGRGGRRGTSTTGSTYPRRECRDGNGSSASAVAFIDDSSFDEVIEANGSTNGTTEG